MEYFERTKKLSNILFGICGLFLLTTIILFSSSNFTEIIKYNFTNDLRGSLFTVLCFMISILLLVTGIALRTLTKDANEELKSIAQQIRNIEDGR